MRARDIRALQREHNKERWRELYAPANDDAAEPDPEGDEAWRDAIAGQQEPSDVDAAGTFKG